MLLRSRRARRRSPRGELSASASDSPFAVAVAAAEAASAAVGFAVAAAVANAAAVAIVDVDASLDAVVAGPVTSSPASTSSSRSSAALAAHFAGSGYPSTTGPGQSMARSAWCTRNPRYAAHAAGVGAACSHRSDQVVGHNIMVIWKMIPGRANYSRTYHDANRLPPFTSVYLKLWYTGN